jgi:hypothetical protein
MYGCIADRPDADRLVRTGETNRFLNRSLAVKITSEMFLARYVSSAFKAAVLHSPAIGVLHVLSP